MQSVVFDDVNNVTGVTVSGTLNSMGLGGRRRRSNPVLPGPEFVIISVCFILILDPVFGVAKIKQT